MRKEQTKKKNEQMRIVAGENVTKETLEGKGQGALEGLVVAEETVVIAVVSCVRGGQRWAPCNEVGDGVDEGAVGSRE